jgi:hypothetical protein
MVGDWEVTPVFTFRGYFLIDGYPTGILPDEHLYAAISIKEAESS